MSAENRLTSIVSYPERGTGGNNRYRGNCSPKLIEDLIGFFKPAEICDYMCGSGTTQDAAHTMGIISHCYHQLTRAHTPDSVSFRCFLSFSP